MNKFCDKAVFLDRDGVINRHRSDYVKNLSEFRMLPNVGKHLSKLSMANFKLIIVTNQSAVNRGLLSLEELEKIHRFMISELSKSHCTIDAVYYCPHTPNENCPCRKPKIGLFSKAFADYPSLDITKSWMIGDSKSDIQAATLFGMNTFKIKRNGNIKAAVDHVLKNTKV